MMMRNVVVLWLVTAALVRAQVPRVALPPPTPSRYYVYIVNGLSNLGMLAHCQSKDNDLGYQSLRNRGDNFHWNFKVNFWGTTLFWCKLEKSDAYVSFESFWPEAKNTWLRDRCGTQGTCIWIAKDDGIYLKNMLTHGDEFIHKWIPAR